MHVHVHDSLLSYGMVYRLTLKLMHLMFVCVCIVHEPCVSRSTCTLTFSLQGFTIVNNALEFRPYTVRLKKLLSDHLNCSVEVCSMWSHFYSNNIFIASIHVPLGRQHGYIRGLCGSLYGRPI